MLKGCPGDDVVPGAHLAWVGCYQSPPTNEWIDQQVMKLFLSSIFPLPREKMFCFVGVLESLKLCGIIVSLANSIISSKVVGVDQSLTELTDC